MKSVRKMCAIFLILLFCVLSSGCMAQQADVVRMKRDLDARISKLDKSKVELQQAVEDANRALQEANGIIATQRAEIKELLSARAEVMDQVTTIKDGDLFEVRGAIDQSEHHLKSVEHQIKNLGQEIVETREDAQVREQDLRSDVEHLKQQILQQNEVLTSQAQKLNEFQGSFVDFRTVLDSVHRALEDQEAKLVETSTQLVNVTNHQTDNRDVAQANWEQVKKSVDSVVSAFEQVSQTLADRLDDHERKLSQIARIKTDSEGTSQNRVTSGTLLGHVPSATPAQELRDSIANISFSQRKAAEERSPDPLQAQGQLFEHKLTQHALEELDRSKIVPSRSLPLPSTRSNEGAVILYQQHYEKLRAGDLQGAFQGFRQFLKDYPRSSLASNAQYWLGECYYGQQQYALAIREFEQVVKNYSTSNKVPAALLKIGYSHLGLQDPISARSMFRQLVRTYPKSRAASKAYARLAEVNPPRKESS